MSALALPTARPKSCIEALACLAAAEAEGNPAPRQKSKKRVKQKREPSQDVGSGEANLADQPAALTDEDLTA